MLEVYRCDTNCFCYLWLYFSPVVCLWIALLCGVLRWLCDCRSLSLEEYDDDDDGGDDDDDGDGGDDDAWQSMTLNDEIVGFERACKYELWGKWGIHEGSRLNLLNFGCHANLIDDCI